MKKILILSTLFFFNTVDAQNDTTLDLTDNSNVKFIVPSDSTGFGTPDGTLTSKQIGPSGGKIVSADGRVELIFPAGALTASTNISIQPTTNPAPNGAGKAYQFEPSGIQFKKPVQILFHYSDDEAQTCPPDLMSFAMQNHKGKWSLIEYDDWDSTSKTLKGFIHHFSGLSNIYDLKMWAYNEDLLVGKTTVVEIFDVSRLFVNEATGAARPGYGTLDRKAPILWFVDGIENGNSSIGTVRGYTLVNGSVKGARYTAPQYLPRKNPAFIRADIYVFSGKKKVYHGARSLRCEINVYDEYKITIVHKGPSVLRCGAELEDLSSFTLKFYPGDKGPEINDLINAEPTVTKQPDCKKESRGGRAAQYTIIYNPGGCEGPVHIIKDMLQSWGMLLYYPAPPDLTIEFTPKNVRIMNGKIHYPGTPGGSTNSHFLKRQTHIPTEQTPDEIISEDDINVGNKIRFTANRTHQEYDRAGDKAEHSFKLIIEPI